MSSIFSSLENIFNNVKNVDDLSRLIDGLSKIERCSRGIKQGFHLSEIVNDKKNYKALEDIFKGHTAEAMLAIANFSLTNQRHKCLVLNRGIPSHRGSYLFRAIGGWKQFAITLIMTTVNNKDRFNVSVIDAANKNDWLAMKNLPAGTLVSIHLRTVKGESNSEQEELALEKLSALFDAVQFVNDEMLQTKPKRDPKQVKSRTKRHTRAPADNYDSENPIYRFEVKVNKLDTFVHAGNAALIARHIREYHGQVKMIIYREEKVTVSIDPDSIWAAAARNGETITYEFFGEEPPDTNFLKELGRATNKYTQMDKVG